MTIHIPTFYFTVDLILFNHPPGHNVQSVKIDRFYYFGISFLRAFDDIISILCGKMILCSDIKPRFQFTPISFHETFHRAQTFFVYTVKRDIQPYLFVEHYL